VKSFYINPSTGDIEFDGQNSLKMVEGDDELVQSVAIAFKTNKGEWFLNKEHGFDRTVIQGKNFDEIVIQDELYETAYQDDRVNTVEAITFEHNRAERKLKVDFKFTKKDGSIVEGAI
jgi:hypothetical protein